MVGKQARCDIARGTGQAHDAGAAVLGVSLSQTAPREGKEREEKAPAPQVVCVSGKKLLSCVLDGGGPL